VVSLCDLVESAVLVRWWQRVVTWTVWGGMRFCLVGARVIFRFLSFLRGMRV